jgi:hypothetical protein
MKRKFNSQRLYKLIRAFVILITIIAITFFILSINRTSASQFCNGNEFKTMENKWDQGFADPQKIYQKDYSSCLDYALKQDQNADNINLRALEIAIFIPLLFFSGVGIYKYIYPVK